MKPAFSVILLTTLIGAGQGLFLAWYSAEWFVLLSILEPTPVDYSSWVAAISFALLAAGLCASFFHLGHPERAWRAATMWRTSWLSREVIALPLAMMFILAFAGVKFSGQDPVLLKLGEIPVSLSLMLGFGAVVAVLALFVCTAMIYTCIQFLRQWHTPLTVVNFFLMGTASGFTLAAAVAAFLDDPFFGYFAGLAVFLTVVGLVSRLASLLRNRRLRSPSTLQSAIGVHHPNIRQLAQGAMGGSFNTRAFIHQYGPAIVRLGRHFFIVSGFVLPTILLLLSLSDAAVVIVAIAFVLQLAGFMAERWYFFVEAEHPQNIYYQMIS